MMVQQERVTVPAGEKSTAELFKDLGDEMTSLIRQEMDLARAEMAQKGKRMGLGAGFFAVAGALGLAALGALVASAIAGLHLAVALWLSALIVGVVLLLAAGVVALYGALQVRRAGPPIPQQAVETTKEDVAWLKTQAKSARP
jgi:Putative Actinobacterial Holin-X, holin superfamily III